MGVGGGWRVRLCTSALPKPPLSSVWCAPPHARVRLLAGTEEPLSPDPLVQYVWKASVPAQLQIYDVAPVAVTTQDFGSFSGIETFAGSAVGNIIVRGPGMLSVDFGTESAAWLEIDSPDMPAEAYAGLLMSVSETNAPYKFAKSGLADKVLQPHMYGAGGRDCCTYRLEIPGNKLLYEGVRFGFVLVNATTARDVEWHVTGIRAVAQTLPVNYVGAFHAPGKDLLTRVWYSSAYCPKLNMEPGYLGAILMDRGDRIGWTGDDHISQAAIMYAFGQFDFVKVR